MNEWEWFFCVAASSAGAITFLKITADAVTIAEKSLRSYERREKRQQNQRIQAEAAAKAPKDGIVTVTADGTTNPT